MYEFIKAKMHGQEAWYLVLRSTDRDTLLEVHNKLFDTLKIKYNNDPHLSKSSDNLWDIMHHPSVLIGKWLSSIVKMLSKMNNMSDNAYLLINKRGGWQLGNLAPKEIVKKIEAYSLVWPDTQGKINIKQFPGGGHYYLIHNEGTLLEKTKCDTLKEAVDEASKYVPDENIFFVKPDGSLDPVAQLDSATLF